MEELLKQNNYVRDLQQNTKRANKYCHVLLIIKGYWVRSECGSDIFSLPFHKFFSR